MTDSKRSESKQVKDVLQKAKKRALNVLDTWDT